MRGSLAVSRENAFTASYRAEWAHFEAAARGDAKVASLQDHLVLHRILDAVYKSAEEGRDATLCGPMGGRADGRTGWW
jgi:predicted dehydrogenase